MPPPPSDPPATPDPSDLRPDDIFEVPDRIVLGPDLLLGPDLPGGLERVTVGASFEEVLERDALAGEAVGPVAVVVDDLFEDGFDAPLPVDRERTHGLLLALAGRVPDDGLAMIRTFLADGEEDQAALFVRDAMESGLLPLTADEREAAAALLVAVGLTVRPLPRDEDPAGLPGAVPMPPVVFAPDRDGEEGLPEQVAIEAVGRMPDVRALWRAWRGVEALPPATADRKATADRTDDTDAPDPGPVRVFLVEAAEGADLVELTAEVQQWLAEVGEDPPRVEVFDTATELPPYHAVAVAGAALLWSADPVAEVRLARVFDGADPATGPFFGADHARAEDDERDLLLGYLHAAEAVLLTPGTMADVVEPDRGPVVPMNFHSDGVWIWPDTVAYYLEQHGLAPDPALADHIRAVGGPPSPLSRAGRHRVLATLTRPEPAPRAWKAH